MWFPQWGKEETLAFELLIIYLELEIKIGKLIHLINFSNRVKEGQNTTHDKNVAIPLKMLLPCNVDWMFQMCLDVNIIE